MGWFCALALLVGLWLLMIAPGRASRAQRVPFEGRAFAHRGLYELDPGGLPPGGGGGLRGGAGRAADAGRTDRGLPRRQPKKGLRRGQGYPGLHL